MRADDIDEDLPMNTRDLDTLAPGVSREAEGRQNQPSRDQPTAAALETAAPGDVIDGFARDAEVPPCPVAPKVEGYRLLRPLGEGAMGVVWLAVQEGTQRHVALKLMAAAYTGSVAAQARFGREIEIAATLEHPHIARVYDGAARGHLVYCAMELIEGLPLDEHVQRAKLDARAQVGLLATISRAVQFAHSRGIIHRDLKPSNVMVCTDGTPKLLDFGLARTMEEPGLTMSGSIAGTPAYMSPEQARGENRTLDVRTDVYSLGVVLYQFITGVLPHKAAGGSTFELLRRVASVDSPPARIDRPDVNRELEAIAARALARDREARYSSASAFADDLDAYLAGTPVKARPQTAFYLGTKWARRHVVPLSIASTLLIGVVAATVAYVVQITAEQSRTREAKLESDRSRIRAYGLVDVVNERLAVSMLTVDQTIAKMWTAALRSDDQSVIAGLAPMAEELARGLRKFEVVTGAADVRLDGQLAASLERAPASLLDVGGLLWELKRDDEAIATLEQSARDFASLASLGVTDLSIARGKDAATLLLARSDLARGKLDSADAKLHALSPEAASGRGPLGFRARLTQAELLEDRGDLLAAEHAYLDLASVDDHDLTDDGVRRRLKMFVLAKKLHASDATLVSQARSAASSAVARFLSEHQYRRLPRTTAEGFDETLVAIDRK